MKIRRLIENFEDKYRDKKTLIGVSSIIKSNDKLLFTLSKKAYWRQNNDTTEISFSCAGGKVENGETIVEALKREAMEEICCDIQPIHSKITYYIDLEKNKNEIKNLEKPSPIVVFEEKYPGIPGNFNAKGNWFSLIFIFKSNILGQPRPSREIPGLLYIDVNLLQKTPQKVSLKFIEDNGGKLVGNEIPSNAIFFPIFTPSKLLEVFDKDIKTLLT